MATRLGSSIVLAICLASTSPTSPARADDPAPDVGAIKNQLGLVRLRLRNLAAAVRGRLDEEDAGADRVEEHRLRVMDQKIATVKAEGAYQQAKLSAEVAKITMEAYEKGTVKRELETVEGDIAAAKAEQEQAAAPGRGVQGHGRGDQDPARKDRGSTQGDTLGPDGRLQRRARPGIG